MSNRLPIAGEYPANWPEIGDRVRAEAGHRCIRCGHRYKTGENGRGEWSPCDEKCTHAGPLAWMFADAPIIPISDLSVTVSTARRLGGQTAHWLVAQWRVLTVHHLDGNKANCEWWNLLPLCQRCHLTVQSRVNPQTPYFLEHSDWFRPYVAGFYAKKYEGREITREEAMNRLEELLKYERLA